LAAVVFLILDEVCFPVFRYHITASGCELAKKLVQADARSASADYVAEPKRINTDINHSDVLKQSVPIASERRLPDCELPAAAVAATAAGGVFSDAVIVDEDIDWRKELGFVSAEQTHSYQSR